jgi:hypothetical protein
MTRPHAVMDEVRPSLTFTAGSGQVGIWEDVASARQETY